MENDAQIPSEQVGLVGSTLSEFSDDVNSLTIVDLSSDASVNQGIIMIYLSLFCFYLHTNILLVLLLFLVDILLSWLGLLNNDSF